MIAAVKVQVVVDNRLRVGRLPEREQAALQREFTHRNPDRAKLERSVDALSRSKDAKQLRLSHALRGRLKGTAAAEWTWRLDASGLSLPRGGLARARSVLEELGHDLDVVDARTEGDSDLRVRTPLPGLEPRVDQRGVIDAVLEVEQGIVRSPTGSGKTVALMRAIVEAGLPALVIVSTGNLFDQWVRRLQTDLGLARRDIGEVGQGEMRIRPITVGMQQSLARPGVAERVAPHFGFLALDEIHLFAAKTFREVIDHFTARYRVGVSDSEKRKDKREFLLYDLVGPPIADVDRDELIDRGVILDVEVRLVPTAFRCAWWEALPEVERPTRWGELLDAMTGDDERNRIAADLAAQGARAGEQVLVFAHLEDQCKRLRADVAALEPRVGLFVARLKKEFQATLAGFLDGSCRVGVGTYKAIGTALDLPLASRGVAVTPIHNNQPFISQVKGRLCRAPEGKASAALYVLWDREVFGLAPVRNWVRWSRTSSVLAGGQWVEGRAYLRAASGEARVAREEAGDG
jgi:superfamily II DNA or RNA helicase